MLRLRSATGARCGGWLVAAQHGLACSHSTARMHACRTHRALQVLLCCCCCCRDESVKEVLKREYTPGIDVIYEVSVTGGGLCCLKGSETLAILLVAVLWCAEGVRTSARGAQSLRLRRSCGLRLELKDCLLRCGSCCPAVCWRRHVQHLCGRAGAQGCADHYWYDEPVCQRLGA